MLFTLMCIMMALLSGFSCIHNDFALLSSTVVSHCAVIHAETEHKIYRQSICYHPVWSVPPSDTTDQEMFCRWTISFNLVMNIFLFPLNNTCTVLQQWNYLKPTQFTYRCNYDWHFTKTIVINLPGLNIQWVKRQSNRKK